MNYENKPVEEWASTDYDDFWAEYIEIVRITKCKLCGKKLNGKDIHRHMERNHFEKYEEHDEKFESISSGRQEKRLDEVQQDDEICCFNKVKEDEVCCVTCGKTSEQLSN